MSNDVLRQIRDYRWLQGRIFPPEANKELACHCGRPLTGTTACIVVSQSCNLVHHDFGLEPFAEVLIANKLSGSANGTLMYCRSTRRIHFYVSNKGAKKPYEAQARDRYNLPRKMLASFAPDPHRALDSENLKTLIAWLITRYDRVAFPDEFQGGVLILLDQAVFAHASS